MKSFEINRFQAGLIQSAFYMGYFLLAMPAALLMRKFNYKTGLITGLFLFSIGCYLFWPAAVVSEYSFFLFALFVIASGLAFLETGANPFIASLVNPETSERRLNFSQSFYPLGAVIGALTGTIFIFSGIEHNEATINAMKTAGEYDAYLKKETIRVVTPYLVLATVVLTWGLFILLTKFPKIHEEKNDYAQKGKLSDLLKYPHFWKGVLG
ncbi:MAG: MFS transporter [Bacteroidales bacterium]|nr:MFS transporter [Bacteroidales bacterium]